MITYKTNLSSQAKHEADAWSMEGSVPSAPSKGDSPRDTKSAVRISRWHRCPGRGSLGPARALAMDWRWCCNVQSFRSSSEISCTFEQMLVKDENKTATPLTHFREYASQKQALPGLVNIDKDLHEQPPISAMKPWHQCCHMGSHGPMTQGKVFQPWTSLWCALRHLKLWFFDDWQQHLIVASTCHVPGTKGRGVFRRPGQIPCFLAIFVSWCLVLCSFFRACQLLPTRMPWISMLL